VSSVARELNGGPLGPLTHLVYSLSKDFSLSGLRAGCVYSENEEVNACVQTVNDLCQVPSHTQQLLAKLLGDEAWVREFLEENGRRVGRRYGRVAAAFAARGFPTLPSSHGLYSWVDLRSALRPGESEGDLHGRLVRDSGVAMTPGRSQGMPVDGFFRCVFTAVDDEGFEEVLRRIEMM
jgi:1-aminocyclopropane-1-carboxylate synthase